ncbi:MAG: hypothetical protein JXB15_06880 [Anaerolineales bacterium]|nr:hypothetical protein [Anaerolineales bacterium]
MKQQNMIRFSGRRAAAVKPVRRRGILFAALSLAFAMLACTVFQDKTIPTQDTRSLFTAAADTAVMRITLEAVGTAVAQLTQAAELTAAVTATPQVPPTETLAPSPTPVPATPTAAIPPTATPIPIPCNQAQFLQDITIPAGSVLPVGTRFIKTWRVQNTGSCSWGAGYALVFASGSQLGNVTSVILPVEVAPGQTADLSTTLTAPLMPGYYQSSWLLRSPENTLFGSGPEGLTPFLVQITAFQPAGWSNFAYDFIANYCAAAWNSRAGSLSCQGLSQDAAGSVLLLNGANLEARRSNDLILWTRPSLQNNGWISGQYPAYVVNSNDHFLAEVGCLNGSAGCDVTFYLDYRTSNGATGRLGAWREVYDGKTTLVDVDLTALTGRAVQFTLIVGNNGNPQTADAFWLLPRIQSLGSQTSLVLDWSREIEQTSQCVELKIYLFSQISAEAQAFSCTGRGEYLGKTSLDSDDLAQLLDWVRVYADFEGEIYDAAAGQPVITYIALYGQGNNNVTDTDINRISRFAEQIYKQIIQR